ncbi:MAG: VOC family protein [Janthinobacterium lividum]
MTTTTPVQDGMHTVTPHLVCAGAVEAIAFYVRAFGAEEVMRLPGPGGKLAHAAIRIGDSMVMLMDEFPDWDANGPGALGGTPVTIHLAVPAVDDWFERAVEAGAVARMAPADMFWGDRYGVVEDPFGHRWSMATHLRDVSPEEMARAMAQGMGREP